MKKVFNLIMSGVLFSVILFASATELKAQSAPLTPQYIVVAWNDLGMHCANLDFSTMCILPPFNNQKAQVIMKGSSTSLPVVMNGSSGVYVTYEIPGNTQSATKTNFWSYSQLLFGVTLAPNMGLAGFGMSGTMVPDVSNYYQVEGIPITAYPDATPTIPDPYQLTLIKAYSSTNQLLASTQSVIPVSHEINCVSSGCHASELAILNKHEKVTGFNVNNRPIFCATCHSDNALGMPGHAGVPPFSQVIHEKHGEFIRTGTSDDCYKSHPGPNTQCWRDVMHSSAGGITKCQDCHGSVSNVGHSIDSGRNPWLQEPSCGATSCHGPNYAEEPGKLFRNSKGHGGLFCSTCHGSPHAILPTGNDRDNVQNIALQGFSGTLSDCSVCHGYMPTGPGPHGILNVAVQNTTIVNAQTKCYNATGTLMVAGGGTTMAVQNGGSATFIAGKKISFFDGTSASQGGYLHGYITTSGQYCTTPAAPQMESDNGSGIVQVNSASSSFRVYPNPTTGKFMVALSDEKTTGKILIEIFGMQGEKLISRELSGTSTHEFELLNRPAGIYYIRLISGNQTETMKIIKQ
ncbi:MAG: T9SS type A sorting domain-containing protein [Bacteroidetes bacterium]|nr:T9SS type A sorting domain-containing protein [Bacteroidota bacterium]